MGHTGRRVPLYIWYHRDWNRKSLLRSAYKHFIDDYNIFNFDQPLFIWYIDWNKISTNVATEQITIQILEYFVGYFEVDSTTSRYRYIRILQSSYLPRNIGSSEKLCVTIISNRELFKTSCCVPWLNHPHNFLDFWLDNRTEAKKVFDQTRTFIAKN